MPSKKNSPTNSDGRSTRSNRQSMSGAGVAEMPPALGMSGEEEMPGSEGMDVESSTDMADELDSAFAVSTMTGGDMPAGEMSSAEEEMGAVAVAARPEEADAAESEPVEVETVAAPRGIVPPADFEAVGLAPVIAAPPSLTNHGGPIIGAVQVVAIYWGAAWSTAANAQLTTQLDSFFDFILTSEYMDMLAEYSTATTTIQHGQRRPSVRITTSEPGTIVGGVRQVTDAQSLPSMTGSARDHRRGRAARDHRRADRGRRLEDRRPAQRADAAVHRALAVRLRRDDDARRRDRRLAARRPGRVRADPRRAHAAHPGPAGEPDRRHAHEPARRPVDRPALPDPRASATRSGSTAAA